MSKIDSTYVRNACLPVVYRKVMKSGGGGGKIYD